MRSWSSWSTRERWVVGVIFLLAAAVAVAQVSGDDSLGSTLTYAGFMLGMVGLALGLRALFLASGARQVESGLSTVQKFMLAAGAIVVAWAAVSTARMDDGFVLAAFVAQVAIGMAYVAVAGLGATALTRSRNR